MEHNNKLNKGTIINIVLFLGLLALYAVHFVGKPAGTDVTGQADAIQVVKPQSDTAAPAMAYVDNEVLMENYMLAIRMRAEFEAEQRRLENDLDRRQRSFEIEVERFYRDVQRGHVAPEEVQILEQELMRQQQDLFQLSETYRDRLMRKELEMNTELLDNIRDFLDRYNADKGYDFILGYARGGGILHANKAYDITNEVLELLNKAYEGKN